MRLPLEPCRPIRREESREWSYSDERIAHRSGRFFSIVGIETSDPSWAPQPLIDQPEVGLLGFVFRRTRSGLEALIQRKHEPGNVGDTQIAPTCQATRSNLDQVHGGSLPPGADLFTPEALGRATILSDSLQSEQGTRFLGKRNRNLTVLAEVERSVDEWPNGGGLEWMPLSALLQRLRSSYEVNTDARSVLVTTPWAVLGEGQPFCEGQGEFGTLLRNSYRGLVTEDAYARRTRVTERLEEARRAGPEVRLCALDRLPHHRIDAFGLAHISEGRGFDVRHFAVRIPGREREAWDQPLVTSGAPGLVELACFVREGTLRFVFRLVWEPGLHDRVELHPTLVLEPGAKGARPRMAARCRPIVETWQSDEGGRFYQNVSAYRLVRADDPGNESAEEVHLTLGEIEALLPGGAFTNESRSALALLLPWI